MPSPERAKVRAAMSPETPGPLIVLAIDKIAGEGLDADLDTLLLMNPVSFKGRVIQQVGRIMRAAPAKTDVEVHDILDEAVPMLEGMHHRRRRLLEKRGFTTGTSLIKPMAGSPPDVGPAQQVGESRDPATPTAARIRAWARAAGLKVSDRGRISAEIRHAYHAAQHATTGNETPEPSARGHTEARR
jgi:superfamily II DNA or RNA helicase